jgi:hypothetical protein
MTFSLDFGADGRPIGQAVGQARRRCGDCQLCCKLLPVRTLAKVAGEKCKHQRHGKGCSVYEKPGFPAECRMWSCRWLLGMDTADMSRPDRVHYVIDVMPDSLIVTDNATGQSETAPCIQVWVDPDYPDAHRDPALRAYLMRRAAEGVVALIRYDNREGMVLAAPSLTDGQGWVERRDALVERGAAFAKVGGAR